MTGPDFQNEVVNPAFLNAGQKAGLEIWRIENFEPVPWPVENHGKFYTGDAYIILRTIEKGRGTLDWELHFWLGKESSQDEYGAAAVYTVQLDQHLGGAPHEYREVQEYESKLFLSNFPNGIRYVPGGVASGFHHMVRNTEKKLYLIKGKKHIRMKIIRCSGHSLNRGDCFILDCGDDVWVYMGDKSKRLERLKAIQCANLIRDDDNAGKSTIHILDEFALEEEVREFFKVLGSGNPLTVADESLGGDDELFEEREARIVSLYKVSEDDGAMKIEKVARKPFNQEMLDSKDCFLLDTKRGDMYVWIGKHCSAKEKAEAMHRANHFIVTKKYPQFTRVRRIVEDAEPAVFRQYFEGEWKTDREQPVEHPPNERETLRSYHLKIVGDGKIITTDIHEIEQNDLDEDDVIWIDTGVVVYVWFGRDATPEEREITLKKAERMRELHHYDKLISMEQGEEVEGFIKLFPEWNPNFWKKTLSYEHRKNAILNLTKFI